ncbi:hypothetical protein AURDEDRAFT_137432 [Auricularia subglabra TFB-10046 SS5]|uniref:AB hydrolase-1 domain-containing protein n=1 Tax=Auricularia subglabra (strain TFB-10046 / SS5) TaxID=717982 RepID=J0D375_AURST|nr:hypothetical protein AURDEDRAFT_137432 [Auricularia subglabra TFB-10046 SS5]
MPPAQKRDSYPRPAELREPAAPYPIPAQLAPLSAPPAESAPPYIPPSRGPWDSRWTRSTHVLPAAYPRRPTLRAPELEGTAARQEIARRRAEHYAGRWERLPPRGEVLFTVAERIGRVDQPGAREQHRPVTLVCTHANGFHKEIWDETLKYLLCRGLPGAECIDEVWTLDAVTQGDAGRVNAEELPDIFDWTENARDILNFLIAYLPPAADLGTPPAQLARIPEHDQQIRRQHGFSDRRIVVLGHSMGGTAASLAATEIPALFDSMILVDPVIACEAHLFGQNHDPYIIGALKRRHIWSSRSAALSGLDGSPALKLWDPAVLCSYVDHGTYVEPSGSVRLKCSPYQEASSFSEMRAPNYAWYRLSRLPPRIALFWIVAGIEGENGATGFDEGTALTVWRRPENASNTRVPGASHLIVQQKPRELAGLVSEFIFGKYSPGEQHAKL